ncbi:MAG: YCF48-related protein [bacterium]
MEKGLLYLKYFCLFILLFLPEIIAQSQHVSEEWSEISTGVDADLTQLFWTTDVCGWAVGTSGTIIKTTDAGNSWHQVPSGVTTKLTGIAFNKSQDGSYTFGAISGEYGTILTTSDGGATWVKASSPTSYSFYSIAAGDPVSAKGNILSIVGELSKVYISYDHGQSWVPQMTSSPMDHLYKIFYLDHQFACIVGSNGIIYITSNGGASWTYKAGDPANPYLYGVYFHDYNFGYITGQNGTILNTTNGGDNWTKQNTGSSQQLNDIIFADQNNGYVVGNNSTLLQTTNGETWSGVNIGYENTFNDVAVDKKKNIWIAGDGGFLYTNYYWGNVYISHYYMGFAAVIGQAWVNPQTVYINFLNEEFNWSLNSNQDWLNVTGNSGYGTGYFDVSVNPGQLPAGNYQGTITVNTPNEPPFDIDVNFNILPPESTDPPFGNFDQPMDGSTVSSSVPITGWALDDNGVSSVKIYRDGSNGDLIFVGDAQLIEGARPDIAALYPQYPNNQSAGWGYVLLTNFLPNGGNGGYVITVIVTDAGGQEFNLGSRTIICDNANAVKPFGAIDTPEQGGIVYGSAYSNTGWALTPPPNNIPTNGSTINVWIDGVNVGNPNYNQYRSDIAILFPEYENSRGAAGSYDFNTSAYTNGVHTIEWTATDNAGNTDGIGSRYFCIQNCSGGSPETDKSDIVYGAPTGRLHTPDFNNSKENSMGISASINPFTQAFKIENKGAGALSWEVSASEDWVTLEPTSGNETGWVYVTVNPAGLPAGEHSARIKVAVSDNSNPPEYVNVNLNILHETAAPIGEFNYPDEGRVVSGSINLSGWALDDVAVQSVKIYRILSENVFVYMIDANLIEGARPDIETFYSYYPANNRAGWTCTLLTNAFEDGDYKFRAEVTDYEGNKTYLDGNTFTIQNTGSALPFGNIDNPEHGGIASGNNFQITGWALTPQPNEIPIDGSTISVFIDGVNLGNPEYNIIRGDIAVQFPGLVNSNNAGISFTLNTTAYEDGLHNIYFSIMDNNGNFSEQIGARHFTIQNHSTVDVSDGITIPKETNLHPAYPNPFNPSTTINFDLSEQANITVIVYDILGRKIRTLIDNEFKTAGKYNLFWNGRNNYGSELATGIYFIVMKTGSFIKTQKCVLMR